MAGFGGIGFCCCGDGGGGDDPDCHVTWLEATCNNDDCNYPEQIVFDPNRVLSLGQFGYHYATDLVIANIVPVYKEVAAWGQELCGVGWEVWAPCYHELFPDDIRYVYLGVTSGGEAVFNGMTLGVKFPEYVCGWGWEFDEGEEEYIAASCKACGCEPKLPLVTSDFHSFLVDINFPGSTGNNFSVCLPLSQCETSGIQYEGDLPGCPDQLVNVRITCTVDDEDNHGWALRFQSQPDADSEAESLDSVTQDFPITFNEDWEASASGTLDIFCDTSISFNASISPDACPVCTPVTSPRGVFKLIGNIAGATLDVCMFGPRGVTYTGPYIGTVINYDSGSICDGHNIIFEIYCKELGGGPSDWTLKITTDSETVELPVEWDGPLADQGEVSGTINVCGESDVPLAAIITPFTGLEEDHPLLACCPIDLPKQCSVSLGLTAEATPVPSQFDPCSVSNCDGIVRTMPLVDTPLECNGNPIGLTGYSPGDKYFIADFPATTHPVAGANAFNGHKLLVWCDGSNMRWARLDEDGCVHLNETGTFTTWDCESFSGTIEYNFDGSQDCCDGFGLSQWVIQVAPNL